MYRFLIVEDEPNTLHNLKRLLIREFPDCTVDTAEDVSAGNKLIETAFYLRQPYDAVILDFRLPINPGSTPDIDLSLCEFLGGSW